MKGKLKFAVIAAFILLTGCGDQAALSSLDSTADMETEEEKQLQIILKNYTWPDAQNTSILYAITDLDQNGRVEIVSSMQQGTGRYSYNDYREVNETLDGLTDCNLAHRGESEADIAVNDVPVYYDSNQDIYYYIFDDITKDGAQLYYENKRAVFLKNGQISERILAYKTTWYQENASVSYKDADGNEINESAYSGIADTAFPDCIKKEACFSWFGVKDLDLNNADDNVRKDILRTSYEAFLVHEIV